MTQMGDSSQSPMEPIGMGARNPISLILVPMTVIGILLPVLLLAIQPSAQAAGEYTLPAFFDTENITLDNGFKMVMKPRGEVRNVSMRLVVGVGTRDFPCGKKETPHFLEHLLFTGTSKHTEAELDESISEHGGTWNAFVDNDSTVYEVDIFSKYTGLAIDTLYEIMTDSTISEENVELSRNIIHRESGGEPSWLRQWLFRRGIGKTALQKAFEYYGLACPELETASDISREEVLDTFRKYYVPNNMTLVVVGDFDESEIVEKVRQTFGRLAERPFVREEPELPLQAASKTFTGTFAPFLDSEVSTGLCYFTNGRYSPDYFPLLVIDQYLNDALYNSIRVENGLSYGPETIYIAEPEWGLLCAATDVDPENTDRAMALIQAEFDALVTSPLDEKTVTSTKRGMLLRMAQRGESNIEYASYYVSHLSELEREGRYIDDGNSIEQVTADVMHEVATRTMDGGRKMVITEKPTLTYTQFYMLVILSATVLAFVGWRLLFGKRRLRISGAGRRHGSDDASLL